MEPMTEAQANRYLPLVFKKQDSRPDISEGLEDGQYGPVQEFAHLTWDDVGHWIERDERAVRRQATFGANAFQMGTSGLCGCTQVTLVSRRAVWMAHFWETYSHGDSDWVPSLGTPTAANGYPPGPDNTDHVASYSAFEERIIDALSEQEPAGPTMQRGRKPKDYIMPEGPPIQANLFNRPDDGTMLFVMSPRKSSRDNRFRYSNRVPLIMDAITDILGRRPVEYMFPYLPLNMRVRRDRELAGQNKRGHALFQYDPDADGAGTRGWRLIYEGREWRGFLT
ncbi:hypothetical protein ASPVEDRAFT_712611 [Aspergillus versicolor CBS 583.65]|uniref:Uncharacterized protein n=1 Tax=Aspergillus versicolor CBS 583.65 TaxID=1036611 RepID=A0A1L9PNA8_ASPVE|nr:uncharacterized protein ASPVEDRAFT_712611 [Aspergillus versicolor CBS 583.65]OJJ03001.1 hypothetical protein ASPVEDRAFT_712611 [Aspergillus versicolor CBS 583.65]